LISWLMLMGSVQRAPPCSQLLMSSKQTKTLYFFFSFCFWIIWKSVFPKKYLSQREPIISMPRGFLQLRPVCVQSLTVPFHFVWYIYIYIYIHIYMFLHYLKKNAKYYTQFHFHLIVPLVLRDFFFFFKTYIDKYCYNSKIEVEYWSWSAYVYI